MSAAGPWMTEVRQLKEEVKRLRELLECGVCDLAIAYLQGCCRDVGCGPGEWQRREELVDRIEKIKDARAALGEVKE